MGIVAPCALIREGAIGDRGAIYRARAGKRHGMAAAGYAVFALMMAGGRFAGDWLATLRVGNVVRTGAGWWRVSGSLVGSVPAVAIAGDGLVGAGVSMRLLPLIMSVAADAGRRRGGHCGDGDRRLCGLCWGAVDWRDGRRITLRGR